MKALAEGEGSETFRVRAQRPLLDWFKTMTAEERGAVLARLMAWAGQDVPAMPATPADTAPDAEMPATASAGAEVAGESSPVPAGPSRPSGEARKPKRVRPVQAESLAENVTALRVASLRVPKHLRWASEKYAEAERLLAQGTVLTANGTKWRTEQGEDMGGRMATALSNVGVLLPAS